MKKITLLFFVFSFMLLVQGQKKTKPEEKFYVMDENFKGTTIEKAAYLLHAVKKNDSSWQYDTYNFNGPMISSEHFKDEKGAALHGQAVYFNKNGTRDSIGNFSNGIPEGSFYYFNDTGRTYLQKEFRNGLLVETIDRIKKDSIDEAERKRKNDTTEKDEIESDFKGGQKGWISYLNKNLEYPDRAQNLKQEGTVVIQFIVDTEGHVYDEEIVKSVEFSLDQETIRIIAASPVWVPAFQNGKKVKSYKKQPLTYKLTRN